MTAAAVAAYNGASQAFQAACSTVGRWAERGVELIPSAVRERGRQLAGRIYSLAHPVFRFLAKVFERTGISALFQSAWNHKGTILGGLALLAIGAICGRKSQQRPHSVPPSLDPDKPSLDPEEKNPDGPEQG